MRHPSNGATIRPAERDRGCIFKDDFRSQANMVASGWTLFNAPTFDARGMVLNGTTQYATIPIQRELSSAALTMHWEFYPNFAHDDGVSHYMLDTLNGVGRNIVFKSNADDITIYAGATINVLTSAPGVYGSLWNINERNVLSLSITSGANTLWLNGTQIDTSATAWAVSNPLTAFIGARNNAATPYGGALSRLYIGHHTSDLAEHTAVYNNTMWSYQNRAVVDLQFRTADYDIGNVRTLDSSGNGNHAQLGNGAGANEPTQGAGRMIFTATDYLDLTGLLSLHTQTTGTILMAFRLTAVPAGNASLFIARDGATNTRMYIYSNATGDLLTTWGAVQQNFAAVDLGLARHTVAVRWTGGFFQVFLNGESQAAQAAYTTGAGTGAETVNIGDSAGWIAAASEDADFKYTPDALNDTQILDYHSNVMRRMGAEV